MSPQHRLSRTHLSDADSNGLLSSELISLTLRSLEHDFKLSILKPVQKLFFQLLVCWGCRVSNVFNCTNCARLRWNIIRTAPCWVVWHNVHSQQHTHMSCSYVSSRLGLSHWDPYAMHRGGCLELYYCNMVEWSWWDASLTCKTNWFPSVLWHCWFGHMTCKNRPQYDL